MSHGYLQFLFKSPLEDDKKDEPVNVAVFLLLSADFFYFEHRFFSYGKPISTFQLALRHAHTQILWKFRESHRGKPLKPFVFQTLLSVFKRNEKNQVSFSFQTVFSFDQRLFF